MLHVHVLTTYNDLSSMPLFSRSGFIQLPPSVVVLFPFVGSLVVTFNGIVVFRVVTLAVPFMGETPE